MKTYIVLGLCVIVLLSLGIWGVRKASLFAYKDAILGGLPHDLDDFHEDKKRLPLNWNEFAEWCEKSKSADHWSAEDLNSRFALKWGGQILLSPDRQVFFALDPQFKDIEPFVNESMRSGDMSGFDAAQDFVKSNPQVIESFGAIRDMTFSYGKNDDRMDTEDEVQGLNQFTVHGEKANGEVKIVWHTKDGEFLPTKLDKVLASGETVSLWPK